MSRQTTCFRCGAVHLDSDVNLTKLHRQMDRHDMETIRAERSRIKAELSEAFRDLKGNTPGDGTSGDPFIGALRAMYGAAVRIVRK